MKRALRVLALVVIPLVVLVGALEGVLRATHWFGARVSWTEPDAMIGWRFTPGREYWFANENDHPITGRINALGWRDRERTVAKPDGVFRVAVLGDSYVEGFQVESESTFTALVERGLRARAMASAEVWNFGRSGTTQSEQLIILERDVLPLNPDVVVLVFTPQNDVADVVPALAGDPLRPFFRDDGAGGLRLDTGFAATSAFRARRRINPLKQRSAIASLAAERYNVWRATRRARAVGAVKDPHALAGVNTLCTATPDSAYAAAFALNRRLVHEIARVCAARGARLVLMSVPVVYEDAVIARLRERDASFDPEAFERVLADLARGAGAGFVPLVAPFLAHHARTGERLHWTHWNYAGHRVVAGELAGALAPSPPGAP